ncbi:MAG TPA: glycosyltransferase, partial [Thermoanaerobaculia bacterium]
MDSAKSRRPVAVLLSRFPLITETFILREVIEMERQGQPVRLVPLLHERPEVVHREALPWMDRALHAPLLSAAVLLASLRALRRRPGRVLRLFGKLLTASVAAPNFLLRTLALFPKSLWVAERLEAEGAAHLHAHFATHPATMALIVSSLTGIPWSMTVHAHDIFVRQAMLRDKLAAARFVRAISRFNREYLERRFPGEVADKVRVIHVGIDPEVYRRLPAPAADPPKILCVASLRPYKGVPVLLEACRRLLDNGVTFRCEIVGEGPMRPELERRIAGLGLAGTVSLLGALPQHEVTCRLGASAVFVLPSIVAPDGQMEGIPVALMEAMAAGRPVVTSALSGIPELVEDGMSGVLVQPGDAPGIAAALKRLLEDPGLRLRMGERGREKVDAEFRLDGTVAGLTTLIDQHAEPADPEVVDLLRRAGLDGAGVRRVHRRMDSMV